jgi:cob(I)alamin adenosyltransferase
VNAGKRQTPQKDFFFYGTGCSVIYTRGGDRGQTGLIGGSRVSKDHVRVEAYGAVDELNSQLGIARTQLTDADLVDVVQTIQNRLFDLGAELATPAVRRRTIPPITPEHVRALEGIIDAYEDALPALREFILPGGTEAAAMLHVARTVARRAERRVVTLARAEEVNPEILRYLNRLSDLLFVLARTVNQRTRRPDIIWQKPN